MTAKPFEITSLVILMHVIIEIKSIFNDLTQISKTLVGFKTVSKYL